MPPYPVSVLIETTNACNLKCRMCFIHGENVPKKREPGFVGQDLCRKAIDELSLWPVPVTLVLHGAGEPLLHPRLCDIIAYAKSKDNITVGFQSNGTLLDRNIASALIDARLDWIGVSVDGAQKDIFEHYRKGAVLSQVEENIEGFLKIRKNKRPVVSLNMVCHPEADIDLFIDRWKGKVETIILSIKRDNDKRKNRPVKLEGPCRLLYESLLIARDGRAVLCCEDYHGEYTVGRFPDDSLYDIWHGSAMNRARRLHEKGDYGKIDICSCCDSYIFHECSEEFVEGENGRTKIVKELSTIKQWTHDDRQ